MKKHATQTEDVTKRLDDFTDRLGSIETKHSELLEEMKRAHQAELDLMRKISKQGDERNEGRSD